MLRKLQRNTRHRWFAGVASGIARFIGLDYFPVRMLIRFLFVALSPTLWWLYLLLAIMLPKQKLYDNDYRRIKVDIDIEDQIEDALKGLKKGTKNTYKSYKKEYKDAKKNLSREYKTYKKDYRKPVYKPQVKVDIQRLDFEDIMETVEGKVSDSLYQRIISIDEKVGTLMPKLSRWRTMFDTDLATIKRSSLEWFPQAIQHYLSLPRDYAEHHILASGATSETELLKQLETLENTLDRVIESQYNNQKVQVPEDLKKLNDRFGAPEMQSDDIGHVLDSLMNRIRNKVDGDIYERVESIRKSILAILPQLTEMGAGMSQQTYNVRHTALEYLPDALDKYMTLPDNFKDSHDLGGGKTAKDILLEQLDILDTTMKDLVGDVYQEDAQSLLIHGRFLKEKFADQKFTLPTEQDKRLQTQEQTEEEDRIRFPDLSAVETPVEIKQER